MIYKIQGGSDGCIFIVMLADPDETAIFVETVPLLHFFPETLQIGLHPGPHISPQNDVTVILHAQVVDDDGQVMPVGPEGGAAGLHDSGGQRKNAMGAV